MKIAVLVWQFPARSETFVLSQIVGLLERGHDVRILAMRGGPAAPTHDEVARRGLMARTWCRPGPPAALPGLLGRAWALGRDALRTPGLALRGRGLPRSMRYLQAWRDAPGALAVGPCDVVLAQFGTNGLRALALRRLGLLQGRLATVFLGMDLSSYVRRHGEHVYDDLRNEGDLFLPCSDSQRQRLLELGFPPERTCVHHMGFATGRFVFAERRLEPGGEICVASVARLTEKKGLEYGVEAVARLAKRWPNLRYRIAGEGPLRGALERRIADLDAGGAVQLLGPLGHEQVAALLRESHVLLAPSVTAADGDEEGIPVALMEAMAAGMPVLSTYHAGIPELVEDGVSGFLVAERNTEALAGALERLLREPERWGAMGRAGRARVEAEFDSDRLNVRLEKMLQDCAKGRPCESGS